MLNRNRKDTFAAPAAGTETIKGSIENHFYSAGVPHTHLISGRTAKCLRSINLS